MTVRDTLTISKSEKTSILIDEASDTKAVLLLAHGAGAGMEHEFFETLVPMLVTHHLTVVRVNFLYMERGSKRPDRKDLCVKVIAEGVRFCLERFRGVPLFIGGKSMGGRMSSHYLAEQQPKSDSVRGVFFLGFPLHPAKKPDVVRAAHLSQVHQPMLFMQGTRDALADLTLLKTVLKELPRARLEIIDTADHSFSVLKKSGLTESEVYLKLGHMIHEFVEDYR